MRKHWLKGNIKPIPITTVGWDIEQTRKSVEEWWSYFIFRQKQERE